MREDVDLEVTSGLRPAHHGPDADARRAGRGLLIAQGRVGGPPESSRFSRATNAGGGQSNNSSRAGLRRSRIGATLESGLAEELDRSHRPTRSAGYGERNGRGVAEGGRAARLASSVVPIQVHFVPTAVYWCRRVGGPAGSGPVATVCQSPRRPVR